MKHRRNIGETPEKQRRNNGETTEKHQRNIGETPEKHRRNTRKTSEKLQHVNGKKVNNTQGKILDLLSEDTQLSAAKLAERIGITSRNVEVNIKKLREKGILIRHGSPKSGYWEIVKK